MAVRTDEFHRSSNGDRWLLICDVETGSSVVRHEPNFASGGRMTETDIPEFLDRTGSSPEHLALQSLLERIDIERRAVTGASNPPVN
jgi:hypothetical protein